MRLGSVFYHPLFCWSNYDSNKSQTTERRNMGLGYRAILFVCFRKAYYRERVHFLFLPHFLEAQIVFCLRGPLAIRQAGNLASPPLTSTNVLNVLTGIPPLHIVARAMYLKIQIWVMSSRDAQLLLNIDKIDKFIKASEIPSEKK
ncbi:hypothetical protein AVEN_75972-1 [Araneus ventricosus]|uniref:Uncharacterized protein n=1 Tax=Araneus ventricosus TaxID=182803 RepID=A0A4Y2KZH5_ARAVE|nr:hypothetical protein AVEN_75972-1 [Araneus ventricosus]